MACEMQVVLSPGLVAWLFRETYEFPAPLASPKGACRVEYRRRAISHPKVLHDHLVGDALVWPARGDPPQHAQTSQTARARPGRRAAGRRPAQR